MARGERPDDTRPRADASDGVPERLRALRAALGLSQEQLGRRLGVSFATVNRWETGRTRMSARTREAFEQLEAVAATGGRAPAGDAAPGADFPPAPGAPASHPAEGAPDAVPEAEAGAAAAARPHLQPAPSPANPVTAPRPDPDDSGLPSPHTAFVGRRRELAELGTLLAGSRLVTVVGRGGSGKTRLAVEAAARRAAPLPVLFVALGTLRDPKKVEPAVAAALGLRDRPGASAADALLGELAAQPRLLLLDGAEHVHDGVADFADRALAAAPGLRLLVTSQRVLGAGQETVWTLPPLGAAPEPGPSAEPSTTWSVDLPADLPAERTALPRGEQVQPAQPTAPSEAAELFAVRVRERLPGIAAAQLEPGAVERLCADLGGLPLAIELAAGWMGTLSVPEILQHRTALLSRPATGTPRGGAAAGTGARSLHEVVEASYELLDPPERRLVQDLSVFEDAFTVEDAHWVTGLDDAVLVHRLRTLVDSSWLSARSTPSGPNRFLMLDTLREYAAGRCADPAELRRRHARRFATLAVESEHALGRPGREQWVDAMRAAVADLDSALNWFESALAGPGPAEAAKPRPSAAAKGDDADAPSAAEPLLPGCADLTEAALITTSALWQWWLTSGRVLEGRRRLARVLAAVPGRRDLPAARALCSAAVLAAESGDYPEAVRCAGPALRVFEACGERERAAFASTVLGATYRSLGRRSDAVAYFERAMGHRRAVGDKRGVSVALNNLALLALDAEDFPVARRQFEQSLRIKREIGEARSVAVGLANLSDVLIKMRRLDAAGQALEEAVAIAGRLGEPQLLGTVECNRGELAGLRGDWDAAVGYYRTAAQAFEAGGHTADTANALLGAGRALHRAGHAAQAVAELRAAEAIATATGNARYLAEVRAALAEAGQGGKEELPGGLTARQAEVLGLVAQGLTNKEAAARLHVSTATIERHLATVYRQLGLRGRVEAARFAAAHGLVPPGSD